MFVSLPDYESEDIPYVRIDGHDTWAMDTTLAKIILPMLLQIRDNLIGVPAAFLPDDAMILSRQLTFDFIDQDAEHELHFERWAKTVDEMIWAFTEITKGDISEYRFDPAAEETRQKRINEGLLLFGRHYSSLWV